MRSPLCVLQTDYMGGQNMYDNLELLLKDEVVNAVFSPPKVGDNS